MSYFQGYHADSSNEALLNVGDKLHLKANKKNKMKETLVCINQNGQEIELPKNTLAGFQPLVDGKEYYLSDALRKFKMPLNVQFVELDSISEDARSDSRAPCQSFRTICLDRISKEKVIQATTILDGQRIIKQISFDVDIELVVCKDTFQSSADYAKICQMFNQGPPSKQRNTQPNKSVYNDDAIQNTTQTKLSQPSAEPWPKKTKPAVPPKPTTRISNLTRADPDPIYEEIGINEREYSESHLVIKDSTYTALDPTYISNHVHQYERPTVNQLAKSTKNHVEKPHLPRSAIALPIRLTPSFKVGNYKPPITKRSEVSKTKPDRFPKQAEISSSSPDTQLQNPYSTPECPTNIPDPHPTSEHVKEKICQTIATYPSDLSSLSVGAVSRLLNHLGMEKHVEKFSDELIDGSMLAAMDRKSLQSLNVDSFHVTKLLKFIDGWRPKV